MNYQLLGKNIRKYRIQLGMKQDELAEQVGCTSSHIGQIENNRGIPSLEMIVNIANALHTIVDQLVIDSLDCPEIVYLRDMEQRIRSMPMPIKLLTCEILQDMIIGAVNEAIRKAEEVHAAEMEKITNGLSLPGIF